MSDAEILASIDVGRGAMPAVPGLDAEQKKQLLDFLMVRDRPQPPPDPSAPPRFIHGNSRRLLDQGGATINGEKLPGDQVLGAADWVFGRFAVLRKGKRSVFLVVVE